MTQPPKPKVDWRARWNATRPPAVGVRPQGAPPPPAQPPQAPPSQADFYSPGGGKRQYGGQGGLGYDLGPPRVQPDGRILPFTDVGKPLQGQWAVAPTPRPAPATNDLLGQLPVDQQGQQFGLPPGDPRTTIRGFLGEVMGNPILGPIIDRTIAAGTLGLAGLGGGAVFGPQVSIPLGIAGFAYGAWKGSQAFDTNTVVGRMLAPLDYPRLWLEQGTGTAAQLLGAWADPAKYGTVQEVTSHLRDSWEASRITFDVAGSFAGTTFTDFDLPRAPGGLSALVSLRRMKSSGIIDPEIKAWWNSLNHPAARIETDEVDPAFAEYLVSAMYGAPGQIREIGSGFIADPLNIFGTMATKSIALGAKAVGATDLAAAANKVMTPRPIFDKGPAWLTAADPGIVRTYQAYRNQLVGLKAFRQGFNAAEDLNRIQRFIIGQKTLRLLEKGTYEAPKWSALNPLSWLVYQLSETPESAAKESVFQFSNQTQAYLSSLDWENAATPERAVEMLTAWKNADLNGPEKFPEGGILPLTIEGRVYQRALHIEPVQDLLKVWQGTGDLRAGLETITRALGISPADLFKRIGAGEADAIVRQLAASGVPGAERVTPKSLDTLHKLFKADGVPYTLDMFHAAMIEKLMEGAGQWAVATFGVKAATVIERFAAAVKAAESAALLGVNITYPVRNALNGEVMMAVSGAYGMTSIREIMDDFNRAGIAPGRLRAGMTMADVGEDLAEDLAGGWGNKAIRAGLHPISEARSAGGKLEAFREYANNFVSKLPGTYAAQRIERWQSARSYYEGFRQWMAGAWRRGVGIPRMPPDLEGALRGIDPRLPPALYAAAESSLSPAEIAVKVLAAAPPLTAEQFVDDVAQALGLRGEDVRRLLAVDGLGERLNQRLAELGPGSKASDRARVFADVRERAESAIDVLAAQDARVAAERAAALVETEGPTGIFELYEDLETRLYETYSNHSHALYLEWEEIRRAGPAVRDLLYGQMRERSARTWARYFDFEARVYDGIADALTSSPKFDRFSKADFLDQVRGRQDDIATFHRLKDKLRDRFFTTRYKGRAESNAAWARLVESENRLYASLIKRLDRRRTRTDRYLVAWSKFHAGRDYASAVLDWRKVISDLNRQDMEAVLAFRERVQAADPRQRNALWLEFQNQRLRLRHQIAETSLQMLRELGGKGRKVTEVIPLGAGLKPGSWWVDLAERYGLSYQRKNGQPHYKHFANAVNKYLEQGLLGQAMRLSETEIAGLPAPDRLNRIIQALEDRRMVKRAQEKITLAEQGRAAAAAGIDAEAPTPQPAKSPVITDPAQVQQVRDILAANPEAKIKDVMRELRVSVTKAKALLEEARGPRPDPVAEALTPAEQTALGPAPEPKPEVTRSTEPPTPPARPGRELSTPEEIAAHTYQVGDTIAWLDKDVPERVHQGHIERLGEGTREGWLYVQSVSSPGGRDAQVVRGWLKADRVTDVRTLAPTAEKPPAGTPPITTEKPADLGTAAPLGDTITRETVASILASQPNNAGRPAATLADQWLASQQFTRMRVPLDAVAPATPVAEGARSRTAGPIIVDRNVQQVGRFEGQFGPAPEVLIVDGKHRWTEAKARGEKWIEAYVGDAVRPLVERAAATLTSRDSEIARLTQQFLDPANATPGGALRKLETLLSPAEVDALRAQRQAAAAPAPTPEKPVAKAPKPKSPRHTFKVGTRVETGNGIGTIKRVDKRGAWVVYNDEVRPVLVQGPFTTQMPELETYHPWEGMTVYEAPPKPAPSAPDEQRYQWALRAQVDELSAVDRAEALSLLRDYINRGLGSVETPPARLHDLTGFQMKADWKRGVEKGGFDGAVLVHSDMSGLGAINDTLGHDAGDELIRVFAQAIRDQGIPEVYVYHVSGDEFNFAFPPSLDVTATMNALKARLQQSTFTFTAADGTTHTYQGATFSYGHASASNPLEADRLAELGLIRDKQLAIERGERPAQKGEFPTGLVEVPESAGDTPGGRPVGDQPAPDAGEPTPSRVGQEITWIGEHGNHYRGVITSEHANGVKVQLTHVWSSGRRAWRDGVPTEFSLFDDDPFDLYTPEPKPETVDPLTPTEAQVQAHIGNYFEQQQAAADLVEAPSNLWEGTAYVLPGVDPDLLPRPTKALWQMTLDERMAAERAYIEKYARAMGRDPAGLFNRDVVRKIIDDHLAVLNAAEEAGEVIPDSAWAEVTGHASQDVLIAKYVDPAPTTRNIRETLGRPRKSNGAGGTIEEDGPAPGGTDVPPPPGPKRTGQRSGGGGRGPRAGQPRPVDTPALEGTPPENGGGARGPGDIGGERPAGPGVDQGPDRVPDAGPEQADLRPGLGDSAGGVRSPASGTRVGRPRPVTVNAPGRTGYDYIITDADGLGRGGQKVKFRDNVAAIRLLKDLEATGRQATPEEQAILVRYTGWGHTPQVFDPYHRDWTSEHGLLKALLTDEEWQFAKGSTVNAHYTAPAVIASTWKALRRMGFDGGRLLEPALGAGHFFGLMPQDLATRTQRVGVELDNLTARLARQLYQTADIRIGGYETQKFPNNYFDLALSNVPFGSYGVFDPTFGRAERYLTHRIHNYFFAKALKQVRPGGVVAFITSRYTLDASDNLIRKWLGQQGDFLGAVRLPRDAFKENAGTEVVTDLIFLRKRGPGEAPAGESWLEVAPITAGDQEYLINEYYIRHPEMVLGEHSDQGSMYGSNEYTVTLRPGQKIESLMDEALARLPEDGLRPYERPVVERPPAQAAMREGTYQLVDGQLYSVQAGALVPLAKGKGKTGERIVGLIGLRDRARAVLDMQASLPEEQIAASRKDLSDWYDRFVKQHGPINSEGNLRAIAGDPDAPFILGLEIYDPDTGLAKKASIFTTNTTARPPEVLTADTPKDALQVAMNQVGRVDPERIGRLLNRNPDEVMAELQQAGLVYHNPEGTWETPDAYLSGNVRAKLRTAEAAAELDPIYQPNVEALRKVIPPDIAPENIIIKLSSVWLPEHIIAGFVNYLLPGAKAMPKALPELGNWSLGEIAYSGRYSVENTTTWATDRADATDLISDLMAGKQTSIYNTFRDPISRSERRVLNQDATLAAREMQQKIQEEFRRWVMADGDRAETMARVYNDQFNATRLRRYDGSHLSLPGVSNEFLPGGPRALRPHQLDAIWRVVSGGQNTLLAHVVGAGKTYEMIGAGMELRRLGLARKPMYVVPNHLLEQWAGEFQRMYPNANLLMASQKDFEGPKRAVLFSRIATGDWDAVIVSHSGFGRIRVDDVSYNAYIQEQLDELEMVIEQARLEGGGKSITVKRLQAQQKNLAKKLRYKQEDLKQDSLLTFDQLGVDALFVDEAHEFKNLFFPTRLQNVKGLGNPEGVAKAFDMFVKVRQISKANGGRGVVFATGTPVSNSLVETYTMQRYMQLDKMRQLGIAHFDSWVSAFADTVTTMELGVDSRTYEPVTSLSAFLNAPEVVTMFRDFADVKTAADLNLPRPALRGGGAEAITVPATPELTRFIDSLVARAREIKGGRVDKKLDNMLKLSTEGRKGAIDMRLIDGALPDNMQYKVNKATDLVFEIWEETKAKRLTQLVFTDFSTPGDKWNVYDELRRKLIARGVPKNEIAFIHDYKTDASKIELFRAVNNGKVRILIGSTQKMGAGMNVQKLLIAEHHLDAPWRPSDVEQRDGRILRWGNDNPEVRILRYVTEGSFDAFMWQTLERKARFIEKLMAGEVTDRIIEDTSDVVLSFAQMKAAASGSPLIKAKIDADATVSKLGVLEEQYLRRVRTLTSDAERIPGKVQGLTTVMQGHKRSLQLWQEAGGDSLKFGVTIGGATFDKPADAGARLGELMALAETEVRNGKPEGYRKTDVVGTTNYGWSIELRQAVTKQSWDRKYFYQVELYLVDPEGKAYAVGLTPTGEGSIRKAYRWPENLHDMIARAQADIGALIRDREKLLSEAAKPFDRADDLRRARIRSREIQEQLDAEAAARKAAAEQAKQDAEAEGQEPPPDDDLDDDGPDEILDDEDGIGGGGGGVDDEGIDPGFGQTFTQPGLGTFRIEGWEASTGSYRVRWLETNTVHLIPPEGGAQGDPWDFIPPGMLDNLTGGRPIPQGQVREDAWYTRLRPMLDELQQRMERDASLPTIKGAEGLDPETRARLDEWLKQMGGAMAEAKLGAMKWGEFKRDLGLLNYSRRRNYNTTLGAVAPYEFFVTQTLAKMALHAIDRPALFANYYRMQKFLETQVTEPGFPRRLAGRVKIPIPFMPEWMGGGMFVDPLAIGLPWQQFAYPAQQWMDERNQRATRVARQLESLVEAGEVSQAEADAALQSQAGPAWDRALALVQAQGDEQRSDAYDFASLMVGPHLPLGWAMNYARGKQDEIQPLPLTRHVKALSAAVGFGPAGGINLEAGIRRKLGLPTFDQWEDYRINRTLADMAAEGLIEPDQALAAMAERGGPLFEQAARRAAAQSAFGTLSSFLLGTPGHILPEGEQRQLILNKLFGAAKEAQDDGDTDALARFFDQYPEYEARLALNKPPEEQMRQFLVSQVWAGWRALPALYRQQVTEEFGDTFQTAFLDKETRAPQTIPLEMLAGWSRTLGRYVPYNQEGAATPVEWAPPEVAAQVQDYRNMQRMWGGARIMALQRSYFLIPEDERVNVAPANIVALNEAFHLLPKGTGERKRFVDAHPELKAYWDSDQPLTRSARSIFLSKHPELLRWWEMRRGWLEAHPAAAPYIAHRTDEDEDEKPPERPRSTINGSPEMQTVVAAYLFGGTPLTDGARRVLTGVYQAEADEGLSFDEWLLQTMAYGGNLEAMGAGASNPAYQPPRPYPGP